MKTLVAPNQQSLGEGTSGGYTLGELARLTGVPASRIGEWKRRGLLPTPSRPSDGRRGRARYRFPAEALSVVRSLDRWRGFAQDADVRFWLWLEGHDHGGVSPEELDHELETTVREKWRDLQQHLPSLPDLGCGPVTEQVRERLFDEIDKHYTTAFLGQGLEFGQVAAAVILSLCGLTSAQDIADWHAVVLRDIKHGDARNVGYVQAACNCLRECFDTFCLQKVTVAAELDVAVSQLYFPLLSFPHAVDRRQNWAVVRAIWQWLCRLTDQWLDEPRRAPEPILGYLAVWRRICYRQRPGLVLFVLASLTSRAEFAQLNALPGRN